MSGNAQETVVCVIADMLGRSEDSRVDRGLWKRYANRLKAAVRRAYLAIDTQVCSTAIEAIEVDSIREVMDEHLGAVED